MNPSDLVTPLESAESLDTIGDALAPRLQALFDGTPAGFVLRGDWLGHALHPVLVSLPMGAWTGTIVLDQAGESRAARRLMEFGFLVTVPTVAAGYADWSTLDRRQRRVGLVHAVGNAIGASVLFASYRRRRHDESDPVARVLAVAGAAVIGVAGYLGGHLVFNQKARVGESGHPDGPEIDAAQLPDQLEKVGDYGSIS